MSNELTQVMLVPHDQQSSGKNMGSILSFHLYACIYTHSLLLVKKQDTEIEMLDSTEKNIQEIIKCVHLQVTLGLSLIPQEASFDPLLPINVLNKKTNKHNNT